jgi:diguanylate cyclase (GGDEF)-like protein
LFKKIPPALHAFLRYLLAIGILASFIYFRFLILPVEEGYPNLVIYPATILSFIVCGFGPGILVSLLGAVALLFFFVPPLFSFALNKETVVVLPIYLLSSLMIGYLISRLQYLTKQLQIDISERKLITDPLTGLFNRRVFLEQLEIEKVKVARLPNYSVALLMLDLDFFKRINDTYGHATGDAVLKAFVDTVRNNSRNIDVPARLGGEEFAILLAGTDKTEALVMAERLREQVAEIVIDHVLSSLQITVSIGAASVYTDDINGEAVMNRADAALYEAKDNGRNQTCWFGN